MSSPPLEWFKNVESTFSARYFFGGILNDVSESCPLPVDDYVLLPVLYFRTVARTAL
jgi:hypothetical protein